MCHEIEIDQIDFLQHSVQLVGGTFVAIITGSFLGLSVPLEVGSNAALLGFYQGGHLVVPLKP